MRKKEMIDAKNIDVCAKLEFIEIFKNSQSISSMKGKSHFLARMPMLSRDQLKVKQLEEEKLNN